MYPELSVPENAATSSPHNVIYESIGMQFCIALTSTALPIIVPDCPGFLLSRYLQDVFDDVIQSTDNRGSRLHYRISTLSCS